MSGAPRRALLLDLESFVHQLRLIALAFALAFALAAAACTEPTRVSEFLLLPAADSSLDPDHTVVGDPLFSCGAWIGTAPVATRVTVDIVFGQKLAVFTDRPTLADLELIHSHGGTVLYQFHLPAVRARMDLAEVATLASAGDVAAVLSVKDLRRYDLRVVTTLSRAVTAADSAAFVALGGKLTPSAELAGVLPDRSIPALRARAGVVAVVARAGVGCRVWLM
ncbi:MAG: hypothetical protein M3081_09480 [Gemmatimonadota bacterium]|nr:hypothetical protein [Gemmatimonadota bacterium]